MIPKALGQGAANGSRSTRCRTVPVDRAVACAAMNSSRRPDGALERDIMRVLWAAPEPLLPAEVNDRLAQGLAYTTVATVLGRLRIKGLVQRAARGRAFAYTAVVPEFELARQRIADVLMSASDRGAVLAGFVSSLSKREAKEVRALLDEGRR